MSADLKSAEQEVKQTADKMAGSAAAAGGSFDQAGKKIKESYKGIQVFTGALGGIVNVVSKILGLFGLLTAGVWLAVSAIRSFSEHANRSQKEVADLKERVKQFGEESLKSFDPNVREFISQIAEADEVLKKSKERQRSARTDAGVRSEIKAQEEAAKARRLAEENLRRYMTDKDNEAARKEEEDAKKRAALAEGATVELPEYDPEKDPLLKSIEESTKRRADSLKFVIDLMHKYQRELNDEYWAAYHKKQEEAHAARMDQIERETREQEEAQRRLAGIMSSQRNQSASGDIKTMISLLKVLVDK